MCRREEKREDQPTQQSPTPTQHHQTAAQINKLNTHERRTGPDAHGPVLKLGRGARLLLVQRQAGGAVRGALPRVAPVDLVPDFRPTNRIRRSGRSTMHASIRQPIITKSNRRGFVSLNGFKSTKFVVLNSTPKYTKPRGRDARGNIKRRIGKKVAGWPPLEESFDLSRVHTRQHAQAGQRLHLGGRSGRSWMRRAEGLAHCKNTFWEKAKKVNREPKWLHKQKTCAHVLELPMNVLDIQSATHHTQQTTPKARAN